MNSDFLSLQSKMSRHLDSHLGLRHMFRPDKYVNKIEAAIGEFKSAMSDHFHQ